MIDFSLNLCYGIVVSADKMEEIEKALTYEEYDEMIENNYSRCINSWTGDDYFIGIVTKVLESETDCIYSISNFTIPSDDDENLIDFKRFFDEHDLWKFIDWKPELLLINFCF